ncbi:MAG: DUF5686 and carboxypeptidase regulatory-like domain-containing protein [Prolixibacteraceae bacterium]|jgi:hypothetical protein|nr:DUF5686 and carboxypeptidase regulatory-like domain-containing protein [Prolixibacteraceae bacterium]
MRKFLILFSLFWLLANLASGHNLKGNIKDKSGQPIPFATVFFKEGSQGTTTNENGDFEIQLPSGSYTVTYRSLGYTPKTETIILSGKPISLSIVLEEQFQEIQEVSINAGVDRAYPIMRKVISLSYVHLNQMQSYGATAYLRGTIKVDNIPGIFRNQLKRQNIDVKSGDILVQESVNQIFFKAPDKYDLQIKSINSSFPKGIDFQVTDILGSSLYQDNIDVLISPVGKNAFPHYNFTYEGFNYEGKNIVNKIRVTPKRKSKLLFEGTIYIMEDYWCLKQADLNFETPVGRVNLYMTYDEVSPSIWLPVSHKFSFDASMMGIKGSGKFTTSMRYTDLQFNQSVLNMLNLPARTQAIVQTDKPATSKSIPQKKPSKSLEKKKEKIDQLLEKKDLSTQEMNKLSRLMQSANAKSVDDSLKTLEITESVKVKIDPKAANRDTSFWNSLRPIPLAPEELQSFHKRDSATLSELNKPKEVTIARQKFNPGVFAPFFLGSKKIFADSTWHFYYSGLFNLSRVTFNAVDGFTVNQEIAFTKNFKPGRSLEFRPGIAYAFGRDVAMGNLGIKYSYAPMHRGKFELNIGQFSEDFNSQESAISPFINSVSSLFFKTNFARFFEDHYVKMANQVDLVNGLILRTKLEWKKISQLENSTNYSFIDKKDNYQPNLPANDEVSAIQLANQVSAKFGIKLEYTPKYYYKIRDGIKKMSHSYFPTFYIGYEKGVSNIFSSISDFDFLNAGISHSIDFSQSSSLHWEVNAGLFTNNRQLHFSDFAHVQTQTSPVLPHEYRHSFYVPNYYALSTSDRFLNGFISYKSPLILLKYLPVLSNTLWREMIWTGYYSSPVNPFHTEFGYTLLEVFYSTNMGVFVGFDKMNFTKVGINMAFRISY